MNLSSYAIVLFLVLALAERAWHSMARRSTDRGELRMRWSLQLLYLLYTAVVIGSLIEHLVLRRPLIVWLSVLGLVLYVASVTLRYVAVRTLGRFWSLHVEIRPEHRLIDHGVYRYVRHPIYSSIILEVISIPLVANAWWTLAFISTAHMLVLFLRLRREETEMVRQLGNTYVEYQNQVGALVPRLGRRGSAKEIRPRVS